MPGHPETEQLSEDLTATAPTSSVVKHVTSAALMLETTVGSQSLKVATSTVEEGSIGELLRFTELVRCSDHSMPWYVAEVIQHPCTFAELASSNTMFVRDFQYCSYSADHDICRGG